MDAVSQSVVIQANTILQIPGLAGALSDSINSILCAAYLPHIAHRNWAFTKNESIRWKDDGTAEVINLIGADKLDPGNYKTGLGPIRAIFAAAAAEFGDEAICREMLRQLDECLEYMQTHVSTAPLRYWRGC